jgi:hypothetical protein
LSTEGSDTVLRRRREGDAPLPRPASLDPEIPAVLPLAANAGSASARPEPAAAVARVPPVVPGAPPVPASVLPRQLPPAAKPAGLPPAAKPAIPPPSAQPKP